MSKVADKDLMGRLESFAIFSLPVSSVNICPYSYIQYILPQLHNPNLAKAYNPFSIGIWLFANEYIGYLFLCALPTRVT